METNTGVLHKVRALLAKAEETSFDAEAEAFTAKAQELIARYRIDRALLDAREPQGRGFDVVERRVDVEAPYVSAKVVLLSNVAGANDCRAVWPRPRHYVVLFGYPDDLAAVEELFTSLLLQVTGALRRAGTKQDAFGRSRTAAFRRAFVMSFAARIGQRLRETVEATVDDAVAESGGALVPILAARAEAVDELVSATFPLTRPLRARVSDAEGWHAGSVFADLADLSVHRKVAPGA